MPASTLGAAPTPALICKIYRQVLRYAGSAVLYAHPARPNLRALYRPEFDIWMNKVKEGEAKAIEARPEWEEFSRRGEQLFYFNATCESTLLDNSR